MPGEISPQELQNMLDGNAPFALIDVREPGEYNSTHIPWSSVIPRRLLEFQMQLRDALQKKLSRYTKLRSIAEELSNTTDLTSIASLAVERAFTLIGNSDACLLFLVNQDAQELSLFASKRSDAIASIRAKRGDQFDRHVLRTHRPLLVNDTRRDFRFTSSVSRDRQVSSVIACPLVVGQSPTGVLRLDSSHPNVYTQDDLRFLDILLNLTAAAVTNARLFAKTQLLAITDGLTGLTLRRPFLEAVERVVPKGGTLNVVTDHVDYYTAIIALMESRSDRWRTVAFNLAERLPQGEVGLTNYEVKYRETGRGIHQASWERRL